MNTKRKQRTAEKSGSTTSCCSSSSSTTKSSSLKSPLKSLKKRLFKSPSSQEKIDAARRKASERLKPEPFSQSKVDRLRELKELKVESSTLSSSQNDALQKKKPPSSSSEGDHGMNRHGIIFSCSLMVYTMMKILLLPKIIQSATYQTCIEVCLIWLQASCLRSLLYLLLLSAFDAIEFGRADALIEGRRLYISKVSKYTFFISVAVVLISFIVVVAAFFIRQAACFMIQGESDISRDTILQLKTQLSRISDAIETLVDRSEDATMGALLRYLVRSTSIILKSACAVMRRLSSLLAPATTHLISTAPLKYKNSVAVCESSPPSSLLPLLANRTLSLSSYVSTRLGVFCIAVLGISRALLSKSR